MTTYATYTIGGSCKISPFLKRYRPLPLTRGMALTEKTILAYASLKYQDSSEPSLLRFEDTRKQVENTFGVHKKYLEFGPSEILTTAKGELQKDISELIGIAGGVATLIGVASVNPNRITRIVSSGKRMDFGFFYRGRKYLLEVKGTTYKSKHKGKCREIKKQKSGRPRGFHGAYGTVTLYASSERKNRLHITLVDPPTEAPRPVGPNDEILHILKHYVGYFQAVLTHESEFTKELVHSINVAATEGRPPAPVRAMPLWRVSEEGFGRLYRGTYFDLRATQAAVETFGSFEAATDALGSKSTFLGVDRTILEAITGGDWEFLAETDWGTERAPDSEGQPNGVLVKEFQLGPDETTNLATNFERRRRRWLQSTRGEVKDRR